MRVKLCTLVYIYLCREFERGGYVGLTKFRSTRPAWQGRRGAKQMIPQSPDYDIHQAILSFKRKTSNRALNSPFPALHDQDSKSTRLDKK